MRILKKCCLLCHLKYHGPHAVCESCLQHFPRLQNPCIRCGTPLVTPDLTLCNPCLIKSPAIDHVYSHYLFIEPLRHLIHLFKFHQGLYLASFLSHLLLSESRLSALPEVFIPMPLHPKRLRTRGFNQALMLTRPLSRTLKRPYDDRCCIKIKHTIPQSELPANKRHTHLTGSFQVAPMPYQHIALVDDVCTTGATANTLAEVFKAQGVTRVDLWCVAKTPLPPTTHSS